MNKSKFMGLISAFSIFFYSDIASAETINQCKNDKPFSYHEKILPVLGAHLADCAKAEALQLLDSQETAEEVAKVAISACHQEREISQIGICHALYSQLTEELSDHEPTLNAALGSTYEYEEYPKIVLNELKEYIIRERIKQKALAKP